MFFFFCLIHLPLGGSGDGQEIFCMIEEVCVLYTFPEWMVCGWRCSCPDAGPGTLQLVSASMMTLVCVVTEHPAGLKYWSCNLWNHGLCSSFSSSWHQTLTLWHILHMVPQPSSPILIPWSEAHHGRPMAINSMSKLHENWRSFKRPPSAQLCYSSLLSHPACPLYSRPSQQWFYFRKMLKLNQNIHSLSSMLPSIYWDPSPISKPKVGKITIQILQFWCSLSLFTFLIIPWYKWGELVYSSFYLNLPLQDY